LHEVVGGVLSFGARGETVTDVSNVEEGEVERVLEKEASPTQFQGVHDLEIPGKCGMGGHHASSGRLVVKSHPAREDSGEKGLYERAEQKL
jgi:hypothetical protein